MKKVLLKAQLSLCSFGMLPQHKSSSLEMRQEFTIEMPDEDNLSPTYDLMSIYCIAMDDIRAKYGERPYQPPTPQPPLEPGEADALDETP